MSSNLCEHTHEHVLVKGFKMFTLIMSTLINENAHDYSLLKKSNEQHTLMILI